MALPRQGSGGDNGNDAGGPHPPAGVYIHRGADALASISERQIGYQGMRIDRMFFDRFADTVRNDAFIARAVDDGQWDSVIDYVNREVLNRPEDYYTLEKLRRAVAADRRLDIKEILSLVFELIPRFKSKDELLDEEFAKFVADRRVEVDAATSLPAMRAFFKSYAASNRMRDIIDRREFTDLATNPEFNLEQLRQVPEQYRIAIPEYIKDYISLNQFAA